MSNQLVGSVYHRIIEEVISSCHVTFEEDGVDQQTLDDMRTSWQKRLTVGHVASFPWDPPPTPQPMINPATLPSNAPRSQQLSSSSGLSNPPIPEPNSGSVGVHIKPEPGSGYDLQNLQASNGLPLSYGNPAALQRAAQQLQEKFPASANVQVNQLQARAAMAQQGAQPQRRPQNIPMSDVEKQQLADHQRRMQEQQRRDQQYHHLQQAQQRAAVNNSQTDGAADWDMMVAQRRADAQKVQGGTYDADLTIRQQVEQMNRAMEGGGLMLPLSEQPKQPVPKKRKVTAASVDHKRFGELASAQHANVDGGPKVPQFDGPNESDSDDKGGIKDDPEVDDDEDAINSDLDDSDDNAVDETEVEGQNGQIMLCTYDKVQRVKAKWKCTLKDGVLTTGGKEYVFHKAQGEFEW